MPIVAGLGSPQEMAVHDEKWHTENFVWGNARVRRKDFWTEEIHEKWTNTMETMRTRLLSCHNCPMKCGAAISVDTRLCSYMMKCFSKLTYTMGAFSDLDFGLRIAQKATEHGVDAFSAPQTMAFAVELYEDGILTDADMPGFPTKTEDRFYWLLDKIVRREGIGDILADGTYWAGEAIGKGAPAYAHNYIRKTEQLPLKLGMLNPIYFLMYCTGEKASITQIEGNFPQAPFPTPGRERGVRRGLAPGPRRAVQAVVHRLGERAARSRSRTTRPSTRSCEIVDWQEKLHYIDDSIGICAGLSSFPLKPPFHIHNLPTLIVAGRRARAGRSRADPPDQAQPQPGPVQQHRPRPAAQGREAAGGPLEEAVPRAREEAPGRVLQVQGLEPRGDPDARDPARAGPGLRGRRVPAAGDPEG